MENSIFVNNITDCLDVIKALLCNNYNVSVEINYRVSQLTCMETQIGYIIKYKTKGE